MSETLDGLILTPSPYTLGIDLGTTNSSVSVYYQGQTIMLPIEGNLSMPSVVRVPGRDLKEEKKVGVTAKKYIITRPNEVFSSVKSLMRNDDWKDDPELRKKFTFGDEMISPTDIAREILAALRNAAQQWTNAGGDLQQVVICVPANSTPIYKKNVRDAAADAGFGSKDENGEPQRDANGEVCGIYLVEEPTAAAISYGVNKGFFNPKTHKEQYILVYDLGGGTFDVTILHILSREGEALPVFKPVSTRGVAKLGGDDFDWAMARLVADRIKDETGVDILNDPEQIANKSILKFKSEEMKIALANGRTEIEFDETLTINGEDKQFDLVIAAGEYEQAINPLLQRSLQCVQEALESAKLTKEDIDRIVLVGGSSKAPWVRRAIVDGGYKEPYTADNVDVIVAQGAAYLGAHFVETGITNNVVTPVLPHHYGIELNDGRFSPLFVKGTEYEGEISVSRKYYNANDLGIATISAWATQENIEIDTDEDGLMHTDTLVSTRTEEGDNLFEWIGQFEVKIPRLPAGAVEIVLELTINEQKDIHARATVDGVPTEAFWNHK